MLRTLSYVMLCMLLIVACMYTSKAQCPATTPLVINSVTATESRCSASGTATVLVSGGSAPYTYSITAGPVLSTPQSSNVFQSLAPGNYTVQVTDSCNTSVTSNFTVTGTYTIPSLNITSISPGCPGSSDGSITINASGQGPFTYSLISPSPVTAGPQTGNVFTGLPAGTYSCQVKDSCGNYQTRTVTLSAGTSSVSFFSPSLQYVDCDSFAVMLTIPITNYRPPYTITVTPPGSPVITHVLAAPAVSSGSILDTVYIHYHHTTGAYETMPITVTNQCGAFSSTIMALSNGMDMSITSFLLPSGCGGEYAYIFDGALGLHCSAVTYTLVSPTGAILATQTNSSTFSGYPPGNGYKMIRQDCCRKDSLQFDWDAGPAFEITDASPLPYASCKEGTTSLIIRYNVSKLADIVFTSGPPSVTFADGTVHTYIYPDTTKNVGSGAIMGYFGPGTYTMFAIDNGCGQRDSVTFTIGSSNDVRHSTFSASLVKGCTDDNNILLNATTNQPYSTALVTVNSIYAHSMYFASSFSDALTNLSSGTYYSTYQYQNSFAPLFMNGMADPGCDVIKDTIVIPTYKQPAFSSAAVALCGTTRQVALQPDSTSGVQPYQYQIIAGPTTTPLQASAVFTGLAPGTYTFLMADACANSYSRNITIDTLALPNVVTTGSTCVGGAATFTLPSSPFYSYSWLSPNGSTSTGNTLTLNPVKASDIGTYTVSVTSTVGGCTSTTSKSLSLNACQILAETLLHFNGQRKNSNIQLNWQTADEINMSYYIIERSTDGIVFTRVQQVAAKGEAQNTYTAFDTHVPAGLVYYRIQSVEKSGAINYSSIISFNNVNAQPFNVYPSLIKGNTPVTVTCPVTSHATFIRVIGVDGKVWRTIPVAAGTTKTSIDVTNLARGSYYVIVTGNDDIMATQVWKE